MQSFWISSSQESAETEQQKRSKQTGEGDEAAVVVVGEGEGQGEEGSGTYRALTVAVGPDTPPSELFAGDAGVAYLLVGMHCCGNLTPSMLRMFTRQRELTGMIQLGWSAACSLFFFFLSCCLSFLLPFSSLAAAAATTS